MGYPMHRLEEECPFWKSSRYTPNPEQIEPRSSTTDQVHSRAESDSLVQLNPITQPLEGGGSRFSKPTMRGWTGNL